MKDVLVRLRQNEVMFWISILAFTAGYGLLFAWAYPERHAALALAGALPVAAVGWRYGARAGILAGLANVILHLVLLNLLYPGVRDVSLIAVRLLAGVAIVLLGALAGFGHDLAERLRRQVELTQASETALRESEARLYAALAESPVGIYRTSPDGKILYANAALLEMLGYLSLQELRRVNVQSIFVDKGDREIWTKVAEVDGKVRGFAARMRRKDGCVFWAEDNGRIVYHPDGRPAYFEGTLVDIDQRVQAEDALRESRRNYQQLFNRMLDGFAVHEIILDDAGNPVDYCFLNVNPAFETLTGLKAADILGRSLRQVLPNADPVWVEIYGKTALTGQSQRFEMESNALGKWFQVVVFRPREGQFATIFTDITERKRVDAILSENEARYWGLFENSPISLWEEDFSEVKLYIDRLRDDGVQDLRSYLDANPEDVMTCMRRIRIIDVNQATLELYEAHSKDELLSGLDRILTEDTINLMKEEMIAIAEGRTMFESEGRNRTLNGRDMDIFLRWSIAPGNESTASQVFLSIVDITARKQAEARERRQAVQAEALTEISRTFLGASLDPEAIFQIVVEKAAALVGNACLLAIVMDHELRTAAYHHANPEAREAIGRVAAGWPQLVRESDFIRDARSGKRIYIEKVSNDFIERIADDAAREYIDRFGLESLIILPLLEKNRVMGTLIVTRDRGNAGFSEDDLAFLETLANDAALMILNTRLYALLKRHAESDALTGALTRRYFIELAERELSRVKKDGGMLSMVMLDVDHFKSVNDTYGHEVGDQALKMIIDACQRKLRANDLIGRFGGEEFLVLLPDTDLDGARRLAERLRVAVEATSFPVGDAAVCTTISLGATSLNGKACNLKGLVRAADEAMYTAKRNGRNRVEVQNCG